MWINSGNHHYIYALHNMWTNTRQVLYLTLRIRSSFQPTAQLFKTNYLISSSNFLLMSLASKFNTSVTGFRNKCGEGKRNVFPLTFSLAIKQFPTLLKGQSRYETY